MGSDPQSLRKRIRALVREYHDAAFTRSEWVAGTSPVPVSGRVFDAREIEELVDSSLDFWLTTGRFAARFERDFAKLFGLKHAILTNSGSSANLLAISALASPFLESDRLHPGDEVITTAAGFPTTLNPILQNRLTPVFVDIRLPDYNIDVRQLEAAMSPRTRAIAIAHTLGNPFDLDAVGAFAARHDLFLIEDTCDALGSTFHGRPVGSFGDLATVSFYPAHHITMGEGGCVVTDDPRLKRTVESLRDWGRDCWCEPGASNTCGKRFDWQLGDLPHGYDHKYIYSQIGYNLKLTDMQAAVGVAQLEKLPRFIQERRRNFALLSEGLRDLEDVFVLPRPTPGADPSWFGYPLTVRLEAPFSRGDLIAFLESRRIATRALFGGNLLRQPAYRDQPHRKIGTLEISDLVMNRSFWLGVYPGLSEPMIAYVIASLHDFLRGIASTARTG